MFLIGCLWALSIAAFSGAGKALIIGWNFAVGLSMVLVIWLVPR